MAGRAQSQAARVLAWMAVLVGTAVGALGDVSFPFFDLVYYQATDPPIVVPVTIYPLAPVKLAVGLLFGPLAGMVTGIGTQLLGFAVAGIDLGQAWNWVVASALGGFLAGWLPRRLPGAWQPSGTRRFAGAAVVGVVATAVGYLTIFLDPLVRPDVRPAFALGEYVTVVGPISVLAALMLPLALAAGSRFHVRSPVGPVEPRLPARPGWRPFAIALALAIAVPLVPLYLPTNVRLIGPIAGSGGPAAAPAPGTAIGNGRETSVSLGHPLSPDPSCESEGEVRSPYIWSSVHVTLLNETGTSVGVTWLDYTGHRDENVAIDADGPLYGEWGAGHVFMFTGPDGGCLMIFKVLGTTPLTIHVQG